jgi:maltose alpha-D-glucosyltransferase / alpha-amylase
LLLAMPGAPVLYYGDEIGMGDNIWLTDRDGVRTPMQWNDSPGVGFSTGDPSTFPFPVIDSEGFTPDLINVASQRQDPDSLLNWLQRAISVRRASDALSLGACSDLGGGNDSVYVFSRVSDHEQVIGAFNLSPQRQQAIVPAGTFDSIGVEVLLGEIGLDNGNFGQTLTLDGFGFAWLGVR